MAQSYPSAPITLVVPFAAGSGTDGVARSVAQKLSERLKQPVIVENKAGASAQIAAQYVAAAKPDGYTLFMTTNTSHSANPALCKSLKYDPIKDFTPILRVGELPFALAVNNNVPTMAGNMPPAFMPSRGIEVKNSQLIAPIPRLIVTPITKRIGKTTISDAIANRT